MSKETQVKPPIIVIKMVPAGVELVLNALNNLPRGQVDGLWQEIASQYGYQLQELQKAANASLLTQTAEALAGNEGSVDFSTEGAKQ